MASENALLNKSCALFLSTTVSNVIYSEGQNLYNVSSISTITLDPKKL